MILLGVNVDHAATVRQARYRDEPNVFGGYVEPDPAEIAWRSEEAGADGITMHVREDRRHVQTEDVERYLEGKRTRLNLEMSWADEMIEYALRIKPDSVCLVPEHREEVTTEGGLDMAGNLERAREVTTTLVGAGIPVSMFIDPETSQLEASVEVGAPWVELHTGSFAQAWFDETARLREMESLRSGMELGVELGLRVNAGHGINYVNVAEARTLDQVHEFNIGHSIISRALFTGIEEAVATMRSLLNSES